MGIATLVEHVATYLHAIEAYEGTAVEYGRRRLAYQVNQGTGRANRVLFCPSESPGTFAPARRPGQAQGGLAVPGRPLATIDLPYEVHCWGYDESAPTSDAAQDQAALLLASAVVAGIYNSPHGGGGSFEVLQVPRFTPRPVELKFGAEFVFEYVLRVSVTDQPFAATRTAKAAIALRLEQADETLIHEETFQVPPEP